MASHSLAAAKRLRKELQNLQRSSSKNNRKAGSSSTTTTTGGIITKADEDDDICLFPDTDNILKWTALIRGPKETPYENGVFQLLIRCGTDYPLAPPSIIFLTKVFHPNVHFRTGDICLDILKKEWSPAWGLSAACRAILALLSHPDADSPLNCDAGNMIRNGDPLAYHYTARMYTIENANFIQWPTSSSSSSSSSSPSSSTTTTKTTTNTTSTSTKKTTATATKKSPSSSSTTK